MKPTRMVFAATAATLLLAGCEYPTDLPIIEQRWVIPVDETSMSVDELLPANVTVVGSDFDIGLDPVASSENLGNLCAACAILNGNNAPVPPFNTAFTSSTPLPTDVVSVEISGGSIDIQITNGLTFDPLENGGSITIDITNGPVGALLGQLVLSGPADAMPAGSVLNRTIGLAVSTLNGPLTSRTTVNVPGGQMALIDVSRQVGVNATATSVLLSSVTVDVNQTVTLDPEEIDTEDLDTDITDRIVEGTIILDIQNPFGVTMNGTIDMGTVSKVLSIPATATSQVLLSYTGDELRQFLGQPGITFSGSGTALGNGITLTPGQVLTLEATLDFTIEIGG